MDPRLGTGGGRRSLGRHSHAGRRCGRHLRCCCGPVKIALAEKPLKSRHAPIYIGQETAGSLPARLPLAGVEIDCANTGKPAKQQTQGKIKSSMEDVFPQFEAPAAPEGEVAPAEDLEEGEITLEESGIKLDEVADKPKGKFSRRGFAHHAPRRTLSRRLWAPCHPPPNRVLLSGASFTRPCREFSKGFCRFGDSCKFIHGGGFLKHHWPHPPCAGIDLNLHIYIFSFLLAVGSAPRQISSLSTARD
jgi:hypothetical protein